MAMDSVWLLYGVSTLYSVFYLHSAWDCSVFWGGGNPGCFRCKRVRLCHVTSGNMQFLGIVIVKSDEYEASTAFKRLGINSGVYCRMAVNKRWIRGLLCAWSHDLHRLRHPCCVQFSEK